MDAAGMSEEAQTKIMKMSPYGQRLLRKCIEGSKQMSPEEIALAKAQTAEYLGHIERLGLKSALGSDLGELNAFLADLTPDDFK